MKDTRPSGGPTPDETQDAEQARHARVSQILSRLMESPEEQHDALLSDECGGDASLRAEIESLVPHLDTGAEEERTLVRAVLTDSGLAEHEGQLPKSLGRYAILGTLGEGGMGTVYEAEQENPRRRVALKIMRPGLESAEMIKRFEREAHVLGQLDHPGIGKIFEAGEADNERGIALPYFAMEFVEGHTLLDHAREKQLGLRARLELLAEVCDAVHHAHLRGFVHRDLKPPNILVTPEGQPKVLDFGVARASGSDVALPTLHTEVGAVIGTLAYMSPEQASGDVKGVDIRADVYALGVIAFELLADRLPFAVESLSLIEALRKIQEDEPPRLDSINQACRGDLSAIVSHALEKDASRRYQSAAAMGDDIRRYLRDEPITARPASALYQLRKFTRRNRTLVGVVLTILVMLALSTGFFIRAWQQESELREQAEDRETLIRAQAYRASIQGATTALQLSQTDGLRARLQEAPPELRGWEWGYLDGRTRDALSVQPSRGRILDLTVSVAGDAYVLTRKLTNGALEIEGIDARTGESTFRREVPREARLEVPTTRDVLAGLADELLDDFDEVVFSNDDGESLALDEATAGRHRLDETIAPDGQRYVRASLEFSVVDTQTRKPTCKIIGAHEGAPSSTWSPDGLRAYTGDPSRRIRAWDPQACRLVAESEPVHFRPDVLAMGPKGNWIAMAGNHGEAALMDTAALAIRKTLHALDDAIETVRWAPDGGGLIASTRAGEVAAWDVSATTLGTGPEPHGSYVYDVAFIDNTNLAASASWDGTLGFWSVPDNHSLGRLLLKDEDRSVLCTAVHASPGGRRLVVTSTSGSGSSARSSFHVVDARTGAVRAVITRARTGLSLAGFLDGGDTFVALGSGGQLLAYSTDDGAARWERAVEKGVQRAVIGSDGTELHAVRSEPAALLRVDLTSGNTLASSEFGELPGRQPQPLDVAISPDGKSVATCFSEGQVVHLFDARSLESVASIPVEGAFTLAFTPDGKRLVIGTYEGQLLVVDTLTHRVLTSLREHEHYVHGLSVSQAGSEVITGSGDRTVRVWSTEGPGAAARSRHVLRELRQAVRPWVEQQLRGLGDAERVLEAIEGNAELRPEDKSAARQVLLALNLENSHR